jgi:predicted lipoprotein with Yx(FWY)xxD motif
MHDVQVLDVGALRRGLGARRGLVLMLAAVMGFAGFLLAGTNAHSAVKSSGTVCLRKTALGSILVNSKGHTLYLFMKDKNGKSSCTGQCATYWPPLTVTGKPTAGTGVKASLLGVTMRSNGSHQVTYNHHPLYRFSLDTAAGQTKGQGTTAFGARWWALSAKGAAVLKAATSTSTTSTSTGTTTTVPYGYG